MNIPQRLPTALPFHYVTDLAGSDQWVATAKRQTFRQSYCNLPPEEMAVQVRYDRMIPMVLPSETAPVSILLVKIDAEDYDGATPVGHADITPLLTFDPFVFDFGSGDVDFIEYPGNADINQATSIDTFDGTPGTSTWAGWVDDGGLYFLILEFADTTRAYSELIQISEFPEFGQDPDQCYSRSRIEAVSNCPLDDMPPTFFAPQKLFVLSPTSRPEYEYQDEIATDGKEQEKALWTKVKKRWRLSFYAIETVCDFCAMLPLYAQSDTGVFITDTYGVSGPVKDLTVNVSWPDETNDCLALVEITFTRTFADYMDCCN
jgi:hypothetical protein